MQILFENDSITVCIKEPGLHSEDTPGTACVPAQLRAHWAVPDAYVGVVHRLDTVTGGVMVYARTRAAAADLSAQIASGRLHKEYRCVCAGVPDPPAGSMQDWLFRDSRKNKVFPVRGPRRGARQALLDYAVLAQAPLPGPGPAGPAALCRVQLHTGRTHQIRVQFASRRHPLLGDGKYGSRVKGPLALWCASLTFTPPGAAAPRTFAAPPPAHGFFAWFPPQPE